MNSNNTIVGAIFKTVLVLLVLLVSGCGGGGGSDAGGVPGTSGNATVTLSGIATDDPISGGAVSVMDSNGSRLCTATTDTQGAYSCEIDQSALTAGVTVTVTGGSLNGTPFDSQLEAIYGFGDPVEAANVTLVTTLVSRIASAESGSDLISRRDAALQRLTTISLFDREEWNATEPASVGLAQLRYDAAARGMDTVLDEIAADLADDDLSPENMPYFPQAHGSIAALSIAGQAQIAVIDVMEGQAVNTMVQAATFGTENGAINYQLLSGSDGFVLNSSTGALSVPGGSEGTQTARIRAANDAGYRDITANIVAHVPKTVATLITSGAAETLTDDHGLFAVEIPTDDTLPAGTSIRVLRYQDSNGNPVYAFDSDNAPTEGRNVTIHLPDAGLIDVAVPPGSSLATPQSMVKAAAADVEPDDVCNGYASSIKDNYTGWFTYDGLFTIAEVTRVTPDQATDLQQARDNAADTIYSFLVNAQPDDYAAVLCSAPGDITGKIPVLFVHGYTTKGDLGGGGGTEDNVGTWGDFLRLADEWTIGGKDVIPFEFRWRTNARFQDVANDLSNAVYLVSRKTGYKVHIVAHSFGGLLSRTFLQGLTSDAVLANRENVASLTTVGAPHSGIGPSGRDGDLGRNLGGVNGGYGGCNQVSCFQAGTDGYGPDGDTATYEAYVTIYKKDGFSTNEIIESLNDRNNILPSIPIQVLIGLRADSFSSTDVRALSTGDGLISFAGQRMLFNNGTTHLDSEAALRREDNTVPGGASVSEFVLGVNEDIGATQGAEVVGYVMPTYFPGYAHMDYAASDLDKNVFDYVPPPGAYDREVEVYTRDHPTVVAVKAWINGHPTPVVGEQPYFNLTITVVDADGTPIQGAAISVNAPAAQYVGQGTTGDDGVASMTVAFYPNVSYTIIIKGPEGAGYSTVNPTIGTGATPSSQQVAATLARSDVSGYAVLEGSITDQATGQGIDGATLELVLPNSTGVVPIGGDTADSDGWYQVSGVPQTQVMVRATAPGYLAGDWQSVYVGSPTTYRQDLVLGTSAGAPTLPAPSLSLPADGAVEVSTVPTLSWSAVFGADRYWLMIASSPSAFPTDVNATSCQDCLVSGDTAATSYMLPSVFPFGGKSVALTPGATYYWKVQAYSTNGAEFDTQGIYSDVWSFTVADSTDTTTALQVNGFASSYSQTSTLTGTSTYKPTISLTGSGFSSITQISWSCTMPNGTICAGSPYVWTAANWSSKFIVSSDTAASVSPTLLTSTDPEGTYSWTVTFTGAAQSVVKSFSVVYQGAAQVTPPAVPDTLTATALSQSSVALTWRDISDNETGFKIERKTGTNGTFAEITTVGSVSGTGSGGYFENSGLAPSTTYCYRMRAYNAAGDSSYTQESCATTQAAPVVLPSATTGTATNVTTNAATLNGSVNPNGAASGGFFQWGTSTSYGNTTLSQVLNSGTTSVAITADLTGLTAGTTYHFRVVATNANGGTSFGNDQSFTTTPIQATTFSITPGVQSVNEASGAATFTVTRSSGAVAQTVYLSTTQTEGYSNSNDYAGLSNQALSFAVGETSKTVTVSITNDSVVEDSNETFGLIIQQNSSDPVTTYLAKGLFIIVDDDAAVTTLSFTGLSPETVATTTPGYLATLSATGTNFDNVNSITFTWAGPNNGSTTWVRGDADWNSRVTVTSSSAMTLQPVVTASNDPSGTWSWTVRLQDVSGSVAERSFTVNYTAPACSDSIDNDGDGLIDYSGVNPTNPDPGCSSATDTSEFNIGSIGGS